LEFLVEKGREEWVRAARCSLTEQAVWRQQPQLGRAQWALRVSLVPFDKREQWILFPWKLIAQMALGMLEEEELPQHVLPVQEQWEGVLALE
jgi:hypothetical protein